MLDPHDDRKSDESGTWQPVRDSWVGGEPGGPEPAKSLPPPLPPTLRESSVERSHEDEAFAEVMLERLAASDWEGALAAADALLRTLPTDADALDCAQMCRAELEDVYVARLGSLHRVPHRITPGSAREAAFFGARAAAVLARVDGKSSLGEIVRATPHQAFEALRTLSELYLQRVIGLAD